jgi:hypothetical protein
MLDKTEVAVMSGQSTHATFGPRHRTKKNKTKTHHRKLNNK